MVCAHGPEPDDGCAERSTHGFEGSAGWAEVHGQVSRGGG
jgi:hypothetical protein